MDDHDRKAPARRRWAELRFSIIGGLLARPPEPGELKAALEHLASQDWCHPEGKRTVRFGVSTIERWYYRARRAGIDPVGALERSVRSDKGQRPSMSPAVVERLRGQHREHPTWTYKLHADNLRALIELDPTLGRPPSDASVRRYMLAEGLMRQRRRRNQGDIHRPRERRSYEVEHVGGLWHLDFHHGRRRVLGTGGTWHKPYLLGILDDRSRLCCHLQWYLGESAEDLVHGLTQALMKRGLPRSLMTDNGPAMTSAEVRHGLGRLGILHQTTLPYTPEQNAKQEVFWAVLEGRLMAMLENVGELSLARLNEVTQAWVEMGYNRERHSEIGCAPIDRWARDAHVLRECPGPEALRDAFCAEITRSVRSSDATITIQGVRIEIPWHYRHLRRVTVRVASWDLSRVTLVDADTGKAIVRLVPLDKTRNADGRRRALAPEHEAAASPLASSQDDEDKMAPLLRKLIAEYAATGAVPAYLPKDELGSPSREEDEDR